jgi:methylthioribulose 1-phosphate dehydratase/enolase-phosphatase E1
VDPADPEELITQLCAAFYDKGWMSGTGGGLSLLCGDGPETTVYTTPSGLQKEDMISDDIFKLNMKQVVVTPPITPSLKCSSCTPLWYVVYRLRPGARCVIHTHSMFASLASVMVGEATEFHITHFEMMKGVGGHANDCDLLVPIIENRPSEDQLEEQMEAALKAYPKCNGLLVRGHGLYVWGDSWQQAKTQCECFDYLFETAVRAKALGVDVSQPPASVLKKRKIDGMGRVDASTGFNAAVSAGDGCCAHLALDPKGQPRPRPPQLPADAKIVVLDIEGATTLISFVHDELFPFARAHCKAYLEQHWDEDALQSALDKMRSEAAQDVTQLGTYPRAITIPPFSKGTKEQGINCVVKAVEWQMDMDRKISGLKALQGLIWKDGYASGELKGHIFNDVHTALQWWNENGVQVYIYSSGSVGAQKLLFGNSKFGDLLPLIAGHFDTAVGAKVEAASYQAIAKQLNVPTSEIAFVSDAEKELLAAREAGVGWPVMCCRPGNNSLTADSCGFAAIRSFLELCRAAED